MAWENANIEMSFLGTLTSSGLSEYCNKSNGWYQYNNSISSFRSTYGTVNTSDTDLRYITGDITLLENSVGSVKLIKDGAAIDIYFYVGGTLKYHTRVANQSNNWAQYLTIWACIDETNHLGAFIFAYTQQGGSNIYIKVCNESQGGAMYRSADAYNLIKESIILPITTSNGGGATHIAKVTGQLKDLSGNLSDILLVSGGGGGGLIVGENAYNGADAGGISGNGSNSADQSTGYAFGQGESGTNKSGGGGGLYGGYKSIVG